MRFFIAIVVLLPLLWAASLYADEPTSRPAAAPVAASQPAPAADFRIVVLEVSGQVQRGDLVNGEMKWQVLKVGDVLDPLTIIRTGLKSTAVIRLGSTIEARINSATKVGISEFRKEGALTKTNLGLKYGTVRAHVDSSREENDFRVSTPSATLSVTGSEPETHFSGDEGARGWSHEGHLTFNGFGHSQTVNPGEGLNEHHEPPTNGILGQFRTLIGDAFGGLDESERRGIAFNGGGRGNTGGSTGGHGGEDFVPNTSTFSNQLFSPLPEAVGLDSGGYSYFYPSGLQMRVDAYDPARTAAELVNMNNGLWTLLSGSYPSYRLVQGEGIGKFIPLAGGTAITVPGRGGRVVESDVMSKSVAR